MAEEDFSLQEKKIYFILNLARILPQPSNATKVFKKHKKVTTWIMQENHWLAD